MQICKYTTTDRLYLTSYATWDDGVAQWLKCWSLMANFPHPATAC